MKKLFMVLALPALMMGCSKFAKPKQVGGDETSGQFWSQRENSILVTTMDNQPIAGAQILIGDSINNPFFGNYLITDASGQVDIPEGWTEDMSVTAQAYGFIRTTYIDQQPGTLAIKLRRQLEKMNYEVKGSVTGLPIEDRDGFIDFGLIMPAFTKLDILSFNINSIISAQDDHISTMGQDVAVPANISIPEQNEKYALFTVNLDKPSYRIYYGQPGVSRVFAARGRFPFKSTVDALREGIPFYDLINNVKIGGGSIRDVEVKAGNNKLNLPARELNFSESKKVMAPPTNPGEIFLAVGVANQSGYMIPTDVKKVSQNQRIAMNINILPNAAPLFLGVLKKSEEMKNHSDRMSATLLPFEAGLTPNMLPLVANPTLFEGDLILPEIREVEGVYPLATYSVLSLEEEVQQGPNKLKLLNPKWEVYSHNWNERIRLPEWPLAEKIPGKKQWGVSFIGSETTESAPMGPAIIEAATHVTHSSVTF